MRTGSGRIINSSFKFNTYPAAKLPVEIGQPRHRLKLAVKQGKTNKHAVMNDLQKIIKTP